jgi:hypothetical protein
VADDDVSTVTPTVYPEDRSGGADIVRDLDADELRAWLPHVGTLAPGVRAVWVDLLRTDEWEPIPLGVTKTCRNPKCRAPGVVERRRFGKAQKPVWWSYCEDHATGDYTPASPGAATRPTLLTRRIIAPMGMGGAS